MCIQDRSGGINSTGFVAGSFCSLLSVAESGWTRALHYGDLPESNEISVRKWNRREDAALSAGLGLDDLCSKMIHSMETSHVVRPSL